MEVYILGPSVASSRGFLPKRSAPAFRRVEIDAIHFSSESRRSPGFQSGSFALDRTVVVAIGMSTNVSGTITLKLRLVAQTPSDTHQG